MALVLAAGVAVWLFAAPPDTAGSADTANSAGNAVAESASPSAGGLAAGPTPSRSAAVREQLFASSPKAGGAADLAAIARDPQRGSRERQEACAGLRKLGPLPADVDGAELHGVVMDVPLNEGIDTVALYADGTSRYVNFAGFSRRIEQPAGEVLVSTKRSIESARALAPQIAPGDHTTMPASQKASRFTFLTCAGDRLIIRTPGDGDELGMIYKGAAEILPKLIEEGLKD